MDDWFAIAIDKDTGWYHTCSIGNKEFAQRTASYYRSIGYSARCLPREDAETLIVELYNKREDSIKAWESKR